jgi:hypothetical protein
MCTYKLIDSSKFRWEKKITCKKPLAVLVVAVSKPRAMNREFTCLQSSWLIAQNSSERKKNYKEKTTASTSSGYEQAQGHEL